MGQTRKVGLSNKRRIKPEKKVSELSFWRPAYLAENVNTKNVFFSTWENVILLLNMTCYIILSLCVTNLHFEVIIKYKKNKKDAQDKKR